MRIKILNLSIHLIFIITILFSIIVSIILINLDYNKFCYQLLEQTGKLHKLNVFKDTLLTPSKFTILRYGIIVTGFLLVFLYFAYIKYQYFLIKKVNNVLACFQDIAKSTKRKIFSFSKEELIAIFIIFILTIFVRLYYTISLPISYDEAWTYLNFTARNILASMSYFPALNNHIFHSILTNLTSFLPFNETINLRIPSLIVSTFTFIVLLVFLKDFFSSKIAILVTTVYSFLYPVIYYSYMSRGYSLVILFFLISLYSILKIIENKNKKKYWTVFSLSSVLGFYTMPSFLYPFFSLCLFSFIFFLIKKQIIKIKYLIFSCLIVSTLVVFLYMPVFIISGVNSITAGVKKETLQEILTQLVPHFKLTYSYFLSMDFGFYLTFFIGTICLFIKRQRIISVLLFYLLIIPFGILIIHQVIPFERTWIYQTITICIFLAIILNFIDEKMRISKHLIYFLSIIFMILGFLNFNTRVKNHEKLAIQAEKLAIFLQENDISRIYVNNDLVDVYLNYHYYVNNKLYDVYRTHITGKENRANKKYNCYILYKGTPTNEFKSTKLIYENDYIKVLATNKEHR